MSIHSTGLSDWEGAPLVVKPKVAWKMLACSNTHGYGLLAAGEITSFLDGRSRKILVASIRDYIARRLAAAAKTNLRKSPSKGTRGRSRGRPRSRLNGSPEQRRERDTD